MSVTMIGKSSEMCMKLKSYGACDSTSYSQCEAVYLNSEEIWYLKGIVFLNIFSYYFLTF